VSPARTRSRPQPQRPPRQARAAPATWAPARGATALTPPTGTPFVPTWTPNGFALTGPPLTPQEAAHVAALYTDDFRFRATVNMGRYRFGDLIFPLQVVINLNQPGVDHTGGEFLVYEQRPRAQSRATATLIPHGHGLVFTTRDRPVESKRGWSAAPVRHGVSVIRSGQRFTLGLVFHDAA